MLHVASRQVDGYVVAEFGDDLSTYPARSGERGALLIGDHGERRERSLSLVNGTHDRRGLGAHARGERRVLHVAAPGDAAVGASHRGADLEFAVRRIGLLARRRALPYQILSVRVKRREIHNFPGIHPARNRKVYQGLMSGRVTHDDTFDDDDGRRPPACTLLGCQLAPPNLT